MSLYNFNNSLAAVAYISYFCKQFNYAKPRKHNILAPFICLPSTQFLAGRETISFFIYNFYIRFMAYFSGRSNISSFISYSFYRTYPNQIPKTPVDQTFKNTFSPTSTKQTTRGTTPGKRGRSFMQTGIGSNQNFGQLPGTKKLPPFKLPQSGPL
jgi:hypothetical protein